MKKVLIISYYYPPMPAVGGLRAQGLAKYLPQFGWQATIVHGALEASGTIVHKLFRINPNQNLLAQAEELKKKLGGLPIDRLLKLYAELFAYPDTAAKWGKKVIYERLNGFDAIISTSSPVSCHAVASAIKQEYNIPWIADLRDLWTQNHYYPYSRWRRARETKLELKTLEHATALTTVSEPLAVSLSQLHHRFVHTLLNGYDPEEVNPGVPLTKTRTITYTGNIYPEHQSPESFFRQLLESEKGEYKIRFYGAAQPWIDKLALKYGLQEAVKQYGVIPRKEALQKQWESHALLYLPWEGQDGVYSQKLFEYVAARRPIVVSGQADKYVSKVIQDATTGDIEKYSQLETARRFADLLDQKDRQ